ncbi:hypothetical protein ACFOGG_02125 [Brenneria rubrifaciens]
MKPKKRLFILYIPARLWRVLRKKKTVLGNGNGRRAAPAPVMNGCCWPAA